MSGLRRGPRLQHRTLTPTSLVSACDKPRIGLPPSYADDLALVGFGPVYSDGDYAGVELGNREQGA